MASACQLFLFSSLNIEEEVKEAMASWSVSDEESSSEESSSKKFSSGKSSRESSSEEFESSSDESESSSEESSCEEEPSRGSIIPVRCKEGPHGELICPKEALIIGSYGNKHPSDVKVARKAKIRSKTAYLHQVEADLKRFTVYCNRDPFITLNSKHVYRDEPGKQRRKESYLLKIANFLRMCKKPGGKLVCISYMHVNQAMQSMYEDHG